MKYILLALLLIGCSETKPRGPDVAYTPVEYTNPDPDTAVILAIGQSNMQNAMLNHLVDMLDYENIEYVNVAEADSRIQEWSPEGDLFQRIEDVADKDFTHILVHQGESDAGNKNYVNEFLVMLNGIRDLGINAPVYLAQTSWLNNKTDSVVIAQQGELIQRFEDIKQGPYTDVLGSEYRFDGTHFNEKGLKAHAQLWSERIDK